MFYDRSSIDIFNHASGALSDDEYRLKVELERLEHIDSMEQAANYMLALAGLPFNEARALPFIGTDAIKSQQQKRKKQDQNFLLWHLVYRFQQSLNRIDQRIAEIDESLNALSELKHLTETKAFNADNTDHKALLKTAGISPDALATDPEKAIDERFDFVWQKRDELSTLREEMINTSQNSHGEARFISSSI